jgi:hypothetical protein
VRCGVSRIPVFLYSVVEVYVSVVLATMGVIVLFGSLLGCGWVCCLWELGPIVIGFRSGFS